MESRAYCPDERPDVEVRMDGVWHQGELRMWQQRDEGSWWANVQWRPAAGETYVDTLPATDVRTGRDGAAPTRATRSQTPSAPS